MATTVAHGLIGISTYCLVAAVMPAKSRVPCSLKALVLAGAAANIPDLDMLVSLMFFSDHKILHGGITHSFAFAGLVAVLVWLLGRRRNVPPVIGLTSFFLVASHVVVDWFTGPEWGLHPSHGLAPFWPFIDTRLVMPLTLFKGVEHANLLPGALYTALWEMLLLGPLTAILVVVTKRNAKHNKILMEEMGNDWIKNHH